MTICWKFRVGNPRCVDECSSSDLEKCIISLPVGPLQWMGAVRMRVQTADKNINSPQVTTSLQYISWHLNQLKYKSSIHNTVSSVEKSFWLNQERNMHRSSTVYKPKQFKTNMSVDFDVRGKQEMDFFTEGSVNGDYWLIFGQKWQLKCHWLICFLQTRSFLLHFKMFTDGLEWSGLLWFLSAVWTGGTHSLQRIHWWASDVMLIVFPDLFPWIKTHLHLGWREGFSENANFGVNYFTFKFECPWQK